MALQYVKAFQPVAVGTGLTTLYTVPAQNTLRSAVVRFINTSGTNVTIEVYAVPSGDSAGDGNTIAKTVGVAANGFLDVAVPFMSAGDVLRALASSATVTAHFMQGALQA